MQLFESAQRLARSSCAPLTQSEREQAGKDRRSFRFPRSHRCAASQPPRTTQRCGCPDHARLPVARCDAQSLCPASLRITRCDTDRGRDHTHTTPSRTCATPHAVFAREAMRPRHPCTPRLSGWAALQAPAHQRTSLTRVRHDRAARQSQGRVRLHRPVFFSCVARTTFQGITCPPAGEPTSEPAGSLTACTECTCMSL